MDEILTREPIVLLDVGARGGVDNRWRPFLHWLRIVGFEADADECGRLMREQRLIQYLPYCVGAHDHEHATLHITRSPQCSSVLQPNTELVRAFAFAPNMGVEREVDVTLMSLQTICREHALRPDALKLDVQGLELDVLQGAGDMLDGVLLVESEVEFNEQYKGQPLFGDVDRFLRQRGFYVLGIRRTSWRRAHPALETTASPGGTLMHGDALWVRDADALTSPRQVLAMSVLLAAYQETDLLASLLLDPHPLAAGWTEHERRALLRQLLPQRSRRFIERLAAGVAAPVARMFHHRQARAWIDALRSPGARDWHDPSFY